MNIINNENGSGPGGQVFALGFLFFLICLFGVLSCVVYVFYKIIKKAIVKLLNKWYSEINEKYINVIGIAIRNSNSSWSNWVFL